MANLKGKNKRWRCGEHTSSGERRWGHWFGSLLSVSAGGLGVREERGGKEKDGPSGSKKRGEKATRERTKNPYNGGGGLLDKK